MIEGRFRVQCAYGVLRFFAGAEVAPSPTAQDSPVILETHSEFSQLRWFPYSIVASRVMMLQNFHCQIIQRMHSYDSGKRFGFLWAWLTQCIPVLYSEWRWHWRDAWLQLRGHSASTEAVVEIHHQLMSDSADHYWQCMRDDIHCNVVWNCQSMLTLSMVMPENLVI